MGGEVCYRQGYERGPWFEMFCLRRIIAHLVITGKDADFEKELLAAWQKIPEYQNVVIPPQFLEGLGTLEKQAGLLSQGEKGINTPPASKAPPDFDVLEVLKQNGGRPRGGLSRTTVWRREKEKEGKMEVERKG